MTEEKSLKSWFRGKEAKYGVPPYLECHSRGDKRFSPFFAYVNGESIEVQFQAHKIFEDGSTGLTWKEAKGRKATNQEECNILYINLWKQYIKEHPELLIVLKQATGLRDMFSKLGNLNQAEVLWNIRNNEIKNEKE